MTETAGIDELERQQKLLPPGWEAVQSDKNQKIYYWNKKTGATTWNFPEQAGESQHQHVMVLWNVECVCEYILTHWPYSQLWWLLCEAVCKPYKSFLVVRWLQGENPHSRNGRL